MKYFVIFAFSIVGFCTIAYAQVINKSREVFPIAQADAPPVIITSDDGIWEFYCRPDMPDICDMVQIVANDEGDPIIEVRIQKLPDGGAAAAGFTIVVPLGTLLSENLTIQVDDADPRRYSFSWCESAGCISRFGMTAVDVNSLKLGKSATLKLVPVLTPDQPLVLSMSLDGFTDAWDQLLPFSPIAQ